MTANASDILALDASVAHFERVHLGREVTVAMSAYGNATVTLIALRALFNAAQGDFELILVDDCSPDQGQTRALFEQVAASHARTRVFCFSRNLEYTGSLNCILSHAQGERVLFLSNDIFVTPSYLRGLMAAADESPSHGVVRGCSNFVDNGLATHNVQTPQITSSLDLFEFGERIARSHGRQMLYEEFLVGDAFMVTRQVLNMIGTFDPLFYGYFGDPDFGLRARRGGFKLVLARGAFAFHMQDANMNYLPPDQRQAKFARRMARVHENWARFKIKYGIGVEEMYESVVSIPWNRLSTATFSDSDWVAPGNYLRHEILGSARARDDRAATPLGLRSA